MARVEQPDFGCPFYLARGRLKTLGVNALLEKSGGGAQVSVGEGAPVLFLSAREPLDVSEVTYWRDRARLVMLRR